MKTQIKKVETMDADKMADSLFKILKQEVIKLNVLCNITSKLRHELNNIPIYMENLNWYLFDKYFRHNIFTVMLSSILMIVWKVKETYVLCVVHASDDTLYIYLVLPNMLAFVIKIFPSFNTRVRCGFGPIPPLVNTNIRMV